MKLNEVFDGLIKNPSNVYELDIESYKYQLYVSKLGFFNLRVFNGDEEDKEIVNCGAASFNGNFKPECEWRLVRKPVPWQEAIQAWLEGKDIVVETVDRGKILQPSPFKFGITDRMENGFNKNDFTQGKWFIAEGD